MPDVEGSVKGQESQVNAATPFSVELVPEPLRTEPYFKSFEGKTLGDVIKSGLEAHKTVGGSVRIPGEKATEDDWKNFYSKLRPADAKAYNVKLTDERAVKYVKPERVEAIVTSMWEAGLHPRQVNHIMKAYEGQVSNEIVTLEQQASQAKLDNLKAVKEKYKDKFDEADSRVSRVAKRFGGEGFAKMVQDYGLNTDPTFFEAMHNIAVAVQEDSWVNGETPKVLSKSAAKGKVDAILNDRQHPYHNANHPSHRAAVQEVSDLRKLAVAE